MVGRGLNISLLIFTYYCEDGMIIIWAQTDRPPAATYGSEHVADEDPEHWKVRISFR